MKTTLFYYTATGNALSIARSLAAGLGETELEPVARYRKAGVAPAAERVGIVFPIYAWGPPRSVEEFLDKLDLREARYVFAVATCGGTAGNALPELKKALVNRGGRLDAGFIVRSPGYLDGDGSNQGMIESVRRLSGKLPPTDSERLPRIIELVRSGKRGPVERTALPGALLGSFLHRKALPAFAGLDSNYAVSEACTGCGTCVRVCPRSNVRLSGGRPEWLHDCDNCGACAAWCTSGAIGSGGAAATPRRHNPAVVAADLMWARTEGP